MPKWTGWWEQRGLGRQAMQNLELDVAADGTVTGSGEDRIGRFTFQGQFTRDARISLVKQYIGRHQVLYEGRNSGEGIFGEWYIGSFDSGRFALRPIADGQDACEEIQEAAPLAVTGEGSR